MKLIGLPLKVEHGGPDRGTVVDQHTDEDTGYTTVTFDIFDDHAGNALSRMITAGRLPDLSLCHNLYAKPDAPFEEWHKEPVEIIRMSSAQMSTDVVSTGQPAATPDTSTPLGVAQATDASNIDLPSRSRDTMGRFTAPNASGDPNPGNAQDKALKSVTFEDTGTAVQNKQDGFLSNLADRVERIASGLDPRVSGELVETFEDMVKAHVDVHKLLNVANSDTKELQAKCASLQEDNQSMRAERKAEFGKMAGDIADALSDIYMQYNGSPMEQSSKDELKLELDKNPKMAKTLQGLPMATVAMSAQRQMADMGTRIQNARVETAAEKESSLTKKLRDYQVQLSALQSAGAAPSVSQSELVRAGPAPIAVAASENKYGETYRFLPSALRDSIARYDSSCGSGRLTPDDYSSESLVKRPRIS
ncbi:hypothetical protein CYMTET_47701 [Cymbomonas tetramitiformis]|uniref:Uncharacterized protein n=1 Tax=Cymbomonas tetramitiformis TaxID=36881 RepID=A0AAE0EWD7_9CHLO|nr:hypothetical protein CYMTET_47701 [Cymbomonas tetramitiformis]